MKKIAFLNCVIAVCYIIILFGCSKPVASIPVITLSDIQYRYNNLRVDGVDQLVELLKQDVIMSSHDTAVIELTENISTDDFKTMARSVGSVGIWKYQIKPSFLDDVLLTEVWLCSGNSPLPHLSVTITNDGFYIKGASIDNQQLLRDLQFTQQNGGRIFMRFGSDTAMTNFILFLKLCADLEISFVGIIMN